MTRARDNADLGDSFGVLGAGVTGGSGLTALSASNLSTGTVPDARFPAGTVLQAKRVSIVSTATSGGAVTYTTASGAVSSTLDTNGIWRWKNLDGEYLTIPSFSASSGNMVVGWWSGGGVNSGSTCANFALGIEWGSAARRTFSAGGGHFTDQYYPGPINHHSSYILDGALSSVDVHAIVRINNESGTFGVRAETGLYNTSTTNYAQWGASDGVVYHMTIMEIKQ